jgi:hypothetical protein
MMTERPAIDVHWFYGNVTSVAAELYVRAASDQVTAGRVVGPRSVYARTLESSTRLTAIDPANGLWKANLEEPCFWTPRQPYRYQLRLETRDSLGQPAAIQFGLGLPVLTARDGEFELEGRRWVLRGFRMTEARVELFSACHESGTAVWVDDPGDRVCEQGSELGVMIVADLSAIGQERLDHELRRVARWPAVGVVILAEDAGLGARLQRETAHVVRAQTWNDRSQGSPRDWAKFLIVDRQSLEDPAVVTASASFGLIVRGSSSELSATGDAESQVALARAACDSLQQELAGRHGGTLNPAGYLVG